jgi:tRNA dimethylallyltransferase
LSGRLIAIFGPTGVGKTQVAIELAEVLRTAGERPVAVSADAMQVYEGLAALTAKPSPEQVEALEHRLVGFVPVDTEYGVAEYASAAHAEIDALLEAGETPMVVGGTGLYLRAALTDLDLKPPPQPGLRAQLEREVEELGAGTLHERLQPETAAAVHPRDRKRIVRALELETMGEQPHRDSEQLWSDNLRRPAVLVGLTMDRDVLAERISERARAMLDGTAPAEVESAIEAGVSRTARKALGFREIAAHLSGELEVEETRALLERRTRSYVKRQLTWMRKLAGVEVIDRTQLSEGETARRIAALAGT